VLPYVLQNLQAGHPTAPYIREFLILMSVCHTVIPEKVYGKEIQYHAASPGKELLRAGIFLRICSFICNLFNSAYVASGNDLMND
jgi:hypothetical protein